MVVESLAGVDLSYPLCVKFIFQVYEPTYIMGPVGFEPTTASAPGVYLESKMVS
jgi:hypothetical protein